MTYLSDFWSVNIKIIYTVSEINSLRINKSKDDHTGDG